LLGYHLRRAQITVFNDFVKTMSEVQITPGQFGVALLICSNPGLTQSALARAVGIERSTMVAVIDALESRGWVERRPSPLDRRSYALVLSDQGNALIEKLRPMVSSHEDRIAANLSDEERAQLIALLSKVADD
jgi:DNA-binding MarR family transcriptional regulator